MPSLGRLRPCICVYCISDILHSLIHISGHMMCYWFSWEAGISKRLKAAFWKRFLRGTKDGIPNGWSGKDDAGVTTNGAVWNAQIRDTNNKFRFLVSFR